MLDFVILFSWIKIIYGFKTIWKPSIFWVCAQLCQKLDLWGSQEFVETFWGLTLQYLISQPFLIYFLVCLFSCLFVLFYLLYKKQMVNNIFSSKYFPLRMIGSESFKVTETKVSLKLLLQGTIPLVKTNRLSSVPGLDTPVSGLACSFCL